MPEFLKPYSPAILIAGNVLLFVSVALFMYFTVKTVLKSKKIEKIGKQIVKVAKTNEKIRQKEERQRQLLEGEAMERSFLSRIDRKISQAGLKEVGVFVTTETVLAVCFLLTVVGIVLGGLFFGIAGMIVGLVFGVLIPVLITSYFAGKRRKQLEAQLVPFLNLIDNYAKMDDDIISIFGKISIYLEPPLSNLLEETCAQTRMQGDSTQALKELSEKVGHPKMKEIIDNIEIASRHEADYSVVIEDERKIVANYLYDRKEKQGMIRNARIECLILLLVGALIVFMLSDGFGYPLFKLFQGQSLGSKIIIGITTLTGIYTIKNLFLRKE